jgi:hypothetical protein
MEKINSKKVGKIIGAVLAVFLLAMVMQPVMAGVSAEITGVELNGQSDFIEVAPGEIIGVEVFFKWRNVWQHQEVLDEIVVGFEHTPIFCLVDTVIYNTPGYYSDKIHYATEAFQFTAPTEPGTYCFYMTTVTDGRCAEAVYAYQNAFGLQMIADFEVIDSEPDEPDEPDDPDEWECIYENLTTLKPNNLDRDYIIRINQRQSELQMEIVTPHYIWVQHGSVSISVEEDVYVQYYTGNVQERLAGKAYFSQIELNPQNEAIDKSIQLVLGVIPHVGTCINIVGFLEELKVDKNDFAIYREVDLTEDFDFTPLEVFTERNIQNLRDEVVVPWRVSPLILGVNAVRVDFPRMEFPYEGTHNVVFCINCKIQNNDIRHYIALPIEIGKQKMEA